MSRPWFAFSKRAAACVGVSAILALTVVTSSAPARAASGAGAKAKAEAIPTPEPTLAFTLPERAVQLSNRGGQTLTVGDTVSYTLEGATDPAAESRWNIDPKVGGLKLGFLFRNGRLFTPLMAGQLSLPPLPVLDEKGEIVARTAPLAITIATNFSEKEKNAGQPPKPEPAIGPLGLPFPAWIQSAIAFTGLSIVLIAAFFIVRYLRRKAAAAIKKMLPKKPYDQAALDRIDALLKQGLIEKGAFKPLYFGISETLKFYFGERFEFDAQESTTSELIALLKERNGKPGLNDRVIGQVEKLFEALDPVKFANIVPSGEAAREVHRLARDLVVSTRKVEVAPIVKEAR
jgi:acyl-CoA-binding protein